VMGCDLTVAVACEAGQLELNVMMPVIAWNALHSSRILRESMSALGSKCIEGIVANPERSRELLDRSTAVATALSPSIGYAATAEIAKEAVRTGKSIRQIAKDRGALSDEQLDTLLAPERMTSPDHK
jgi:aspartate ammonia-lyase